MKIKLYYSVLFAIFIFSSCAFRDADDGVKGIYDRSFFYTTRGSSYCREGKYDLAVSDFNKTIKIEPENHEAYYARAKTYILQKNYDLALSDFNKAIDINPFPPYYRGRGSVYYMKKQYDSAVKEYIKAIRLNTHYAEAYNDLAWLLATCNDEKYRNGLKAIEFAKKAVGLSPKPSMLDTLAASYAEAGDFDNAVKTQEKAIQLLNKEGKLDRLDECEKRLESYKRYTPWTDI